jgi:hypothetical protein
MLSNIVYLDIHSLSIYEHLGDNSQLINWIPIDQHNVNHKQKTFEFIENSLLIDNNIKDEFLSIPMVHESTGFKKECFNKLMSLPVDSLIIKSIEYDRCLYDHTIYSQKYVTSNSENLINQE